MFALAASATTARAAMATPPRVAAAPRARRAAIVPAPVRSRRHGIAPRGASRRVVRVDALPFGFGKKDPAEEEPEEEEEEEDAVVDGNPFASIGGRVLGAVADAEEKASAAGNPFASFMSRDEPSEPEEEEGEEEEEETEDKGPAFGNPFASFGSLGKSINLSQTIDLDYGDDEEEEEDEIEEEEAPAIGNPFAGIASGMLARSRAAVKRTSRSAPPEPEPEPEKKQMGNWERTLKEGIKDGGAFVYTLVPIRLRRRGERRSLRTFSPGVSLRPGSLAFNPRPRCLSTPSDAFQLHPDFASYGTTLRHPDVDARPRARARRQLAAATIAHRRRRRRRPRPRAGDRLRREGRVRLGRALPVRDGGATSVCDGPREHERHVRGRTRAQVRSVQTFFTRPSVSTFDRVGPFQLTDEHFLYGTTLRKNNRFRVFNGQIVRLGAENMNGEPFVVFDAKLTGANEMDRNSEYGQVQALVEALGGPQVVVNFLFINVAFQLGFYAITLLQTN